MPSLSGIWTGLENFAELFFYMPGDLKATFFAVFGFLIALGAKRIYMG